MIWRLSRPPTSYRAGTKKSGCASPSGGLRIDDAGALALASFLAPSSISRCRPAAMAAACCRAFSLAVSRALASSSALKRFSASANVSPGCAAASTRFLCFSATMAFVEANISSYVRFLLLSASAIFDSYLVGFGQALPGAESTWQGRLDCYLWTSLPGVDDLPQMACVAANTLRCNVFRNFSH